MTFDRELIVAASPDRVWAFLWDVERVARCLPGCQEAKTVVPHKCYEAVVSDRVGPFRVRFPMEIRVLEVEASHRLKAQASGRDAAMGSGLRVTLDLTLASQPTGSSLRIAADVAVLGKLGALGQGIINHKAEGIMTQFAEAMQRELEALT
jgi:carbon monoxide dehydrogenase subunit G